MKAADSIHPSRLELEFPLLSNQSHFQNMVPLSSLPHFLWTDFPEHDPALQQDLITSNLDLRSPVQSCSLKQRISLPAQSLTVVLLCPIWGLTYGGKHLLPSCLPRCISFLRPPAQLHVPHSRQALSLGVKNGFASEGRGHACVGHLKPSICQKATSAHIC